MIKLTKYSTDEEKVLLGLIKSTAKFNDVAKDVEDEIIANYTLFTIIDSLPRKGTRLIDNIILADYCELKRIKPLIDGCGYSFFKSITSNKKNNLKDMWKPLLNQYDKFVNKSGNMRILDFQKIKACPYCNEHYITKRREKSSHQLDHFFNKVKYPIFALSIYNLVPSCYACNHIKLKNDIELSPFDDSFDFEDIVITHLPIASKKLYYEQYCDDQYNVDNLMIILKCSDPGNMRIFQTNIDALGLDVAYENHKDYLMELIIKGDIYTEIEINHFLTNFPWLFSSREEVIQLIFGNYINYLELNQRPLAKMTRDYLREIGILK